MASLHKPIRTAFKTSNGKPLNLDETLSFALFQIPSFLIVSAKSWPAHVKPNGITFMTLSGEESEHTVSARIKPAS